MGRIANELRSWAFFIEAWLQSPLPPSAWFTGTPVRREVSLADGRTGLLTLPGGGQKHAALVFSTGVGAGEELHQRVVRRSTAAFARIGARDPASAVRRPRRLGLLSAWHVACLAIEKGRQ